MPRDTVETETDTDRLLASLTNLPRNKRLDRARADNAAAIAAVEAARIVFTEHSQRLHRANAGKLDRFAEQAEADFAEARAAHRATVVEMEAAREAHAPVLNRHVADATEDIRKALSDALANVERIASALCTAGKAIERDAGAMPALCRNAYAARAMVRHVAGLIS